MPRSRPRSRSRSPSRRSYRPSIPDDRRDFSSDLWSRPGGGQSRLSDERDLNSRGPISRGGISNAREGYPRRRYSRSRSPPPRRRSRSPSHERRNGRQRSPLNRPPRPSPPASRPKSPSPSGSAVPAPPKKLEPDFNPSGLLAAATNTVKKSDGTTTILKYNEPPEARKPSQGWRLYVFKGKEQLELFHIYRQSAYLIGRDRVVADIATEHPSCSKQHAVIQYRQVTEKNEWGEAKNAVKPFVIDLDSTNGTIVNGETVPASRYYELKANDVMMFGQSQREYVLINEDAT